MTSLQTWADEQHKSIDTMLKAGETLRDTLEAAMTACFGEHVMPVPRYPSAQTTTLESPSSIDQQVRLEAYRQNLQYLQMQQAMWSVYTPLPIILEIEEVSAAIRQLESVQDTPDLP